MLSFKFHIVSPFQLISSYPPLPHFFILLPTSECRRRGATGRLRRRLGSGGVATTSGTALGPGGCHPRGRPGLSRAPARTHAPISEEPLGGVGGRSAKRRLGRYSKGRSFAAVTEADGDGRRAKVLLLWRGERAVLWCSLESWRSGGLRPESGAVRRSRSRASRGCRVTIVLGKRRSKSGCYQGQVGFHLLLGGRRRPCHSSTSPHQTGSCIFGGEGAECPGWLP